MPRSPGHGFYDRLQTLLSEAGFDGFVETTCKPFYAPRMGAPSVPPGRYFRMHMIGYFEGIGSERGIAWRCSDSLSLRGFLRLGSRDKVPDDSWLSKTRSRLPHEVHEKVFGWVLALVGERGLVKGARIGVDGSTMEADYRAARDRRDLSPDADPHGAGERRHDAEDRRSRPARSRPQGQEATTLPVTLEAAARNLDGIGLAPSIDEPCILVGDKGYHSRDGLKDLDGGVWRTRIAEPKPAIGYLRWRGDEEARRAVYANRARLQSGVGRDAMRKRGEMVARSFAHVLERGGMRRAWLRGLENVHKRYLVDVAGFNLGILMRALFGCGTPPEATRAQSAFLLLAQTELTLALVLIATVDGQMAMLVVIIAPGIA